jgi:hypothetical protein
MILKKISLYLLTTVAMVTAATTAMADSLVGNGSGGDSRGDYSYELWQTTNSTGYYLKIWKRTNKQQEPILVTPSFESSRKALDYFDCYYAGKSLPVCPK